MSATPLGTRTLKIMIDGVERSADVSKVEIVPSDADSDFTSFEDAANGGKKEYTLSFTATQDPADPESIWTILWTMTGQEIETEVFPYGGDIPTPATPSFQGTVIVTEPDSAILGGEADASATARFTMDLEWKYTAKPTMVTV